MMTLLLKIPCSKLQGIFDRKECGPFIIRSLSRFNTLQKPAPPRLPVSGGAAKTT